MRLFVTPLAEQDLEEIGDYIAQDNPRRAASFVKELHDQCAKICLNPACYRERLELSANLRSCAYGNYVIFFEVFENQIDIIRFLHSARDIPSEFESQ